MTSVGKSTRRTIVCSECSQPIRKLHERSREQSLSEYVIRLRVKVIDCPDVLLKSQNFHR